MSELVSKYESHVLGKYIEQSTNSNYGLQIDRVRGVSISKKLIMSKANMIDVDLSDYKVLKKMNLYLFRLHQEMVARSPLH